MKILIVSTKLTGGAGNVAWHLANCLAVNNEVHILTAGLERLDEEIEGVVIHRLRYRYPMSLYYSTLGRWELNDILSKYNFDIVNIHLALPWGFLLKDYPVKKVISDHGIDYYIYKNNWFRNLIHKYAVGKAFSLAETVISTSRQLIDRIEDEFRIKVAYIPNGVDLKKFCVDKSREKHNIVLFLGRFIEIKGIQHLLEAAKELPEFEFWFAGGGLLEAIIKGDNVKNLGYVERPEELMKEATICIFPSYVETMPLVGLEAMACGKPVIATRAGFSEYIEDGKDGIIIEAKSSAAIVKSVTRLMNDKELREALGINARIKAEQYSWDHVCERYLELFQKIIKGN